LRATGSPVSPSYTPLGYSGRADVIIACHRCQIPPPMVHDHGTADRAGRRLARTYLAETGASGPHTPCRPLPGGQVRSWRLHTRTGTELRQLAQDINPVVAGWMTYYGRFYRSALYPLLQRINTYLLRWADGNIQCTRCPRLGSFLRLTQAKLCQRPRVRNALIPCCGMRGYTRRQSSHRLPCIDACPRGREAA
jgi:hypothetical protein